MKYRNYNMINKINKIVGLKLIRQFLPFVLLMVCFDATAQYDVRHYIAPADWNYFTNANEIVVCTNSALTANITISRSDGTVITSALTATQGNPAVFRFAAAPNSSPVWAQSTILSAAGIIVTSNQPISVNLRNVMSDSGGFDAFIKGNASLFSFGSAGIGTNFRVGYYRNVGAATDLGYTIMAIENGTQVSLNGVGLVTLNAGQSYIIPGATTTMGSLVTASKGSVMTVYKHIDSPGGCGDGTYDQIPPVSSLGLEYVVYRSSGTATPEQNTVIATAANTVVTNQIYNATTGAFISSSTTTLVNAGDFITYTNGDGATAFSANRIVATKKVAVYAGQAQSCEVDITSVTPVSSPCNGSRLVETYKFRNYASGNLPYFGYVLIQDATSIVLVNGVNIETIAGVRRQLGTSGWYLIDFTNVQISSPNDILITCPVNIAVSMVQQGGGFSMSSIFSNFVSQPEVPSVTYNSTGACVDYQALLTAQSGYSNYQWYLNDVAISGANSQTYTTSVSGSYSYSALLPCGDNVVSPPISVTILACSDVSVVKTVSNATPNVGSNVTFTITATANGPHNAVNAVVNDVLPAGYTFVSATPSVGSWTAPNWTIGNLANGASATLTIVATVNAAGPYANTATISGTGTDLTPANNTSTVTPVPVAQTNLAVVKTVSNATPNVGSNVTFTLTASNAGLSNATGVSVNDVLPAGYTFVSATPSVGSWTAPNWTIGNLANGASATLTIVATVNAAGPYANTAIVSGAEVDPIPANNTSTVTPVPVAQTNLAVVKTVSNATPNVGSNVTFTLTASNAGLSNATGVSVNDVLPAGYTFVSATPSVGSWTAPNWTIGNLANGASATLTIVATVNAAGPYANTAIVSGAEVDPIPANNTSTVTPVPVNIIDAVTETQGPINSTTGGTTTSLTTNDTLNGTPVVIGTNPGQITLTPVTVPTGLVLNPDGTVTVNPNTPAGSYNVTYTICEVTNPGNCDTVTSVVTVTAAVIDAVTETVGPINSTTGGTTTSLTTNDTLNGTPVVIGTNPGQITLTPITVPTGLVLNPDGTVTVNPNTPAGSYNVTYTICEVTNPGNCDTVTSVVTVTAAVIDAVTETVGPINSTTGGTTTSLTTNDTLNGTPVVIGTNPGQITLTPVTVPTGLVLNPDGTVTVNPNTPAGSYNVTYTICEVTNPGNCDTVTSIVTVTAPIIDAVTDTVGPINGYVGGNTTPLTANDTLNGTPVVIGTNPGQVTLTPVTVPTGFVLNTNGTVTIPAGTPAGNYTVIYTICEVTNPGNCDTVTSIIMVAAAIIDAQDDSATTSSGSTGVVGIMNVFDNDTLNGSQLNLSEVTFNVDIPDPTNHIILHPDGTVDVTPGTPAGTYQITYTICEILNPTNCSTAVVTVIVNTIDDLDIYTHMTPNGDGDNDVFFIDGINKYPNNTVEIYNRWGVLVYQAKGYNNTDVSFKGTSQGRTTVNMNDDLPEGTYYYILRYTKDTGETKEQAAYLYLNR